MDDREKVVRRAATGDPRAMEQLLIDNLPQLEAYVRLKAGRLVRAKQSITDLVQSVCVEVLRDAGDFDYRGESAFRHWLCKRALHKILSKKRHWTAQRRDAAREVTPVSTPDAQLSALSCYASICTPSRIAMGQEALERFESAFDALNEDYREAITLYRVVGLSYQEVATEMQRSEGAVRNLVYRGLAQLARRIDE